MDSHMFALVNEERVLQLSLFVASVLPEDDPIRETADSLIIGYIANDKVKKGLEVVPAEVVEEFSLLRVQFLLDDMAKRGLVEEEISEGGESLYSATQKGKDLLKERGI